MIDEERIKRNLEDFSFPRLSGTQNEKQAFDLAKLKLSKLNLNPITQNFLFSTFYSRVYPKTSLVLTFWLLFILILINDFIILILNLIILSLIFIFLFIYTRTPEKISLGTKYKSQNLIVKIPSKAIKTDNYHKNNSEEKKEENKNIYFSAHLDSKGQKLSINARIRSYKAWLYSSFILVFLYLSKFIMNAQVYVWIYYLAIIILCINFISTVMILINTTNNKSIGAIDNASGIACVMEMINHYSENNSLLQNFGLNFIFTGAEETGTMGIRHFYNSLTQFDIRKDLVFNFDGIGNNATAFGKKKNKSIYKNFNEIFKQEAKKFNIGLKTSKFYIGVHSDGIFMLRKKNFTGFGFGDEDSYKFVHSINDTIDKVNPLVLKELCQSIANFIDKLDKN